MMPRIDARERLARMNDGVSASGWAKPDDVREHWRELEGAAFPQDKHRRRRARPADFAAMGIAVTTVGKANSDG